MQEYVENPHASAWVMAHAGSGKTYALVRRVIALLLAGADMRTIWCVTYTNIAAAEMQARTISKLNELAALSDAALKTELSKYLGIHAGEEHATRLRAIARSLSRPGQHITCTTMHGLCQQILRIFALELGISPSFTALDAENQRSLMQRACDNVLNAAVGSSSALAGSLAYVSQRMGSYASVIEQIETLMHTREAWLHAASQLGSQDHVIDAIYDACTVHKTDSIDMLLAEAHRETLPAMREVASMLLSGSDTDAKKAPTIDAWLHADATNIVDRFAAYSRIFLTAEGTPQKKLCTKILTPEMPLGGVFYREQLRVVAVQDHIANLACAHDSAHMARLFYAAYDQYNALKAQSDALDFDDMILYAESLLSNPQSLGYVMSKLDYRVEHILVDEAQDTSPAQWRILSTLIEDLCAAGASNLNAPTRSAFVVGDTKQSIYSFQGAAPWMMAHTRDAYAEMFAGHGKQFAIGKLANARRSVPKILEFVDAIGAHDVVRKGWMEAPEPHRPTRDGAGHIELWPLVAHDEKTVREPYSIPTSYSLGTRAQRKLAEQIAETIKGWIASGRPLSSSGEAVSAGDIMIIVRRRGKLVPALIRALEVRGVAVAGMDRVKLSQHIFVRDVLALIGWCFQPEDDVALAQILRSPIGGFSEDDLFALAHDRDGTLWQALQAAPAHEALVAVLRALCLCKDIPVYHMLAQLLYGHGMLTRYRARLGNEVQEVIDEVLLYAASLEGSVDALPIHFRMRMRASQTEIKRESAPADQVRILTVHGSKGLESPIVILADMTELPTTAKDSAFKVQHGDVALYVSAYSEAAKASSVYARAKQAKKEALEAEYYREFYVAITRAEDELYLCSTQNARSSIDGSWYQIAESTLRAREGAVVTDDDRIIWADIAPVVIPKKCVTTAPLAPLPGWMNTEIQAKPATPLLTPSRFGVHDKQEEEGAYNAARERTDGDARDYGMAIHGLLEWATYQTPPERIAQALAQTALSARDKQAATDTLTRLWQNVEIQALLQMQRLNEQAISGSVKLPHAVYPVYGIIDRLVLTDDEVLVIDYKTTLNPPTDAPAHYIAQMALYRAVLLQMYPSHKVRCALLWTHTARIDWLSESVMDSAFAALTNNLGEQNSPSLDLAGRAA